MSTDRLAAADSRTLAAASPSSDDWTDDVWAAWARTADRAHDGSSKQRVVQLEAEIVDLDTKLKVAERQNAEMRQQLTAIRHLHKDSPMGPCPVCVDSDALARGDDYTVPYPCPTARAAGATDCEPKGATA